MRCWVSELSRTMRCCRPVRGDFLAKLGRVDEAGREFERAAALTRIERERGLFLERAAQGAPPPQT
jgi:predicted RNA polymerase sigma factor